MEENTIHISQIVGETVSSHNGHYTVCWIKNEIECLEINGNVYQNISNSIIFLDSKAYWKIGKSDNGHSSGYILYLAESVLSNPLLSNLHINQVRFFSSDEIPLFKLSPGIEKRTQAILEMIDELLVSQLNHRDDAILSLLNTFFVYCDGQCNIQSVASSTNSKTNVVYKYKQLVDKYVSEKHDVSDYAELLTISPKYLNECVKEVLSVSSKNIIIEQLLMRSRHALKFTDKTVKEISFELGFSTPDYFSYFFKTHTGMTPSSLRKS